MSNASIQERVYLNDIGLNIDLDMNEDVSGAGSVSIEYQKPTVNGVAGAEGSWAATVSGTNVVRYTTVDGDLDVAGVWKIQAKITNLSGFTGLGNAVEMKVYDEFEGK